MAEFEMDKQVKKTVEDTKGLANDPEQALKKLNDDIVGSGATKGTADYQNYVGKVAEELDKQGVLPSLSIAWAKEKASAPGKAGISREELDGQVTASQTDKDQVLEGKFAGTVKSNFDTLRDKNIDIDPATSKERDLITPADLEQAKRQSGVENNLNICLTGKAQAEESLKTTGQERDTAVKQVEDLTKANGESQAQVEQLKKEQAHDFVARRSETYDDLAQKEAKNSKITVNAGEGYWHVAARVLGADGHKHSNAEINALHLQLQALNKGKALNPNDEIVLRTKEAEAAAVDTGMKAWEEKEAKRKKDASAA